MGRRLGLATPGSRLKPHRVDVFGRGFFDVRRHGVRPAKDDDEINRTRDIGQPGVRLQDPDAIVPIETVGGRAGMRCGRVRTVASIRCSPRIDARSGYSDRDFLSVPSA